MGESIVHNATPSPSACGSIGCPCGSTRAPCGSIGVGMREFDFVMNCTPKNGQIERYRNPRNGHLKGMRTPKMDTRKVWIPENGHTKV